MYDNLKKIGKDEKWLVKEIQKFKIRPQQALIFVQNGDGSFFCQEKQEK